MENFDLLKQLFCIHSKSGNEKKMRRFITKWVKTNVPDAIVSHDNTGNLYVVRGKCDSYPCICSHMDQVQNLHSKDFMVVDSGDMLCGYSPKTRSFQGLGADDKNGIWVALICLQKYDVLKCAFFVGEEVGCVGSENADMDFFADCRFCVQVDRRGHEDFVTDICGPICSEDFILDVDCEKWGYKLSDGATTDVEALRRNGLGISCVNMSCGYYKPHTDNEYVVKANLIKCLRFVEHIIEDCTKVYPFAAHVSRWGIWNDNFFHDEEMDEALRLVEEEVHAGRISDTKTFAEWWLDMDGYWYTLDDDDAVTLWKAVQFNLPLEQTPECSIDNDSPSA